MNKRIVKIPRISMCGILQIFRSLLCFRIAEKCYTNWQFSCSQSVSTTGWQNLKRTVLMSKRKKDGSELPVFSLLWVSVSVTKYEYRSPRLYKAWEHRVDVRKCQLSAPSTQGQRRPVCMFPSIPLCCYWVSSNTLILLARMFDLISALPRWVLYKKNAKVLPLCSMSSYFFF